LIVALEFTAGTPALQFVAVAHDWSVVPDHVVCA
jgi:hypothetical protein